MGLKPFATFEEWNPRGDVAEAARRLYAHPDNIELYVGLQVREHLGSTKENTSPTASDSLSRPKTPRRPSQELDYVPVGWL